MADRLVVSEEEAIQLLAYLVSSAEISLFEPELYGPFRLIDAASRLLAAMLPRWSETSREFLTALQQEIDQKKVWLMWDREGFRDFLRQVPAKVAAELKRREDLASSTTES